MKPALWNNLFCITGLSFHRLPSGEKLNFETGSSIAVWWDRKDNGCGPEHQSALCGSGSRLLRYWEESCGTSSGAWVFELTPSSPRSDWHWRDQASILSGPSLKQYLTCFLYIIMKGWSLWKKYTRQGDKSAHDDFFWLSMLICFLFKISNWRNLSAKGNQGFGVLHGLMMNIPM